MLHIGDHDPSGVHLFKSMSEDVSAIAADLDLPGRIRFSRLAVNPEQIAELALPTAPAKRPTGERSLGKPSNARQSPPDVLAAIVTNSIAQRTERHAYADVLIRARLMPRLTRLLDEGGAS